MDALQVATGPSMGQSIPRTSPSQLARRRASDGPRRATACLACRKLKARPCPVAHCVPLGSSRADKSKQIKCHHVPGPEAGPCVRCKRRGLACTVSRPLQQLLLQDDDGEWKQTVTRKIHLLESTVESLSQQWAAVLAQQPAPTPGGRLGGGGALQTIPLQLSPAPSHDEDITMDMDSGPASIPASSLNSSDASRDRDRDRNRDRGRGRVGSRTGTRPGDVIADGIVTESQATVLFADYARRLDHYLYGILGASVTLDGVRASSATLLAAICTVAALHSADLGFLYEPCYRRFVNLAANLALADDVHLDDIRSLCIGAFWLHRLSWHLSSLAVRIAVQKHLHRSFRAALRGGGGDDDDDDDDPGYSQTRLYYLVYVCDHHFSIAYGRPPLTRDADAIRRARDFLSRPQATENDARLVSQVELWSITSRVLETFGFEDDPPSSSPTPSLVARMRRFAIEYDTWRADWNDRFGRHVHVGNYPAKGVKLHVSFAKLYLCSHAFRGVAAAAGEAADDAATPPRHPRPPRLDPDLADMAAAGIQAARGILETMVSDTEIQAHLHGLPLYFNTMIAFAVAFLFKIATRYPHAAADDMDVDKTLRLVARVADTLRAMTAQMSPRHLLATVSRAVDALLAGHPRHERGPDRQDRQDRQEGTVPRASSSASAAPYVPADTPARTAPSMWPPLASSPQPVRDAGGRGEDVADVAWGLGPDFDWMTYDFLSSDGAWAPMECPLAGGSREIGFG